MSAHLDRLPRPLKALDGIKHDNVELVRCALRQTFSDPQQRVEAAGFAGAPFSYANAVSILLPLGPPQKRLSSKKWSAAGSIIFRLIRGVSVVILPKEIDPLRSLPLMLLRVMPKAFFTREQIDRVVDDLKERAREESAKARCFMSDSEWVDIDKV